MDLPNPHCPPPWDESFLTALFNGISEAVYAVDLDKGCIVYWNTGAEAMFGYGADEALRRSTEFLQPDRRAYERIFEIAVPEIRKNGFWRGEWNYRRRSGAIFPAQVTASVIRAATPAAENMNVLVVVRDVSERKELENQIHRLNRVLAKRVTETTSELISVRNDLSEAEAENELTAEQFRLLIQGVSNLAILTLDVGGRVMSWNSGAERIFGYQESQIIGKPFSLFYQQSEPQTEKVASLLENAQAEGSFGERAQLLRQDGSSIYADVVIAPFYNTTGRLLRFSVIVRDLTERVVLGQKLQEKEHLAAIGTTAAMFAHEVSNPLNGMSTTVQLLEQVIGKRDFPDKGLVTASLDDLNEEIRRLRHLLDEFRSLARPSAPRFELVDLAKLVRDVIKLSASDEARHGIQFIEELPSDLLLVTGDAYKLKQALLNLIKNAVEATHGAGTITLKGYQSDADVYLDVKDTGDGVPENVKIFDLFQTTKSDGTGLGLVIVQQIISVHGGSISYTSKPHQGTTFHLTLPSAKSFEPE
jgi:PAS domain S-box-containing protein